MSNVAINRGIFAASLKTGTTRYSARAAALSVAASEAPAAASDMHIALQSCRIVPKPSPEPWQCDAQRANGERWGDGLIRKTLTNQGRGTFWLRIATFLYLVVFPVHDTRRSRRAGVAVCMGPGVASWRATSRSIATDLEPRLSGR